MSRLRVLIADDEQHIVTLISMTLRRHGYEVLTADNGQRVLDLAGLFAIDLFIVDQTMPGMSGTDLAASLSGTAPVLMVTARPEIRGDQQADLAGVIHKPFSPKELVSRVEQLIGPSTTFKEQSA